MSRRHRWFELLLRLLPVGFRERHADDMRDAYEHAHAAHRATGRLALTGFLVRTTVDLLVSGVWERTASGRTGGPVLGRHTEGRGADRAMSRGAGRHLERGAGRGLFSLLDVKLGVRMLMKHPGLTLASTFALAVGIPVGLAPAHFVDGIMAPLPVAEGDRIRSLRLWSPALGRAAETTYVDYQTWRPLVSSFEALGAFRETTYNVDPAESGGAGVRGAGMTASAFEIVRVQPLLGRYLQPADEAPGAEDVVVIGYDLWQARYAGDGSIVGRSVRLGSTPHTVVGVMPEGFYFPERQNAWTPLRVITAEGPEQSPPVAIFGRLTDGVDDEQARAELALLARRSSYPGRDEDLQAQVEPYAHVVLPGLSGGLRGTPEYVFAQSIALLVLLVACLNVGMLVFARTATRASELAVRTALGASRGRIVAQVFTECLVLAVLASGVGLLLMALVLDVAWRVLPASWGALPYWIDWSISDATAVRALALAGLSAAVAGVVPALRFTGRSVQSNIQRARANRTGVRFGGLSSALIVLDVAVAVAAVGLAVTAGRIVRETAASQGDVGIAAEEYLAASVTLPPSAAGGDAPGGSGTAHSARMAIAQGELVRRLEAEPGVRAVAVADYLPRMDHRTRLVEAEGVESPEGRSGFSIRTARVDLDFFESLGQPILQGRAFDAGDLGEESGAVIVNTSFVERVLGGQNPIGRRIRYHPWGDGEPGPWREIVGVVGRLGMRMASAESDQGVYEPFAPGDLATVRLGIHLGDDPGAFAGRLRTLAGEVDPEVIVDVTGPLDRVYEGDWYFLLAVTAGGALLVGVLLALAASGIYAIMSFAVAERAREIGIRTALGAGRADLVRSIGRRAFAQIGLGVLLGMPLALDGFNGSDQGLFTGAGWALLVGVAVMVLVGLVACTGPMLRALRVHPSEVLRTEG
jgi:predicted permease